MKRTNMNNVTHKMQGMTCPSCGMLIPCTVTDIIEKGALTCPKCGLVLKLDSTKSKKAIEAINKVIEDEKPN